MICCLNGPGSFKQDWKPYLIENLNKHSALLDLEPTFIIEKIIRGEFSYFSVNSEFYIVCNKYIRGLNEVLFIYFVFGKNLAVNFKNFVEFLSKQADIDIIEFNTCTDAHKRLYSKLCGKRKHIMANSHKLYMKE
jgi:hypothetical protein